MRKRKEDKHIRTNVSLYGSFVEVEALDSCQLACRTDALRTRGAQLTLDIPSLFPSYCSILVYFGKMKLRNFFYSLQCAR